jgi:plasmid stability protein
MRTLTVRNLPPEVAEALEREKRRRGGSLNQTVIDLLAQGLGVGARRSNGLARLAGTWSAEDLAAFDEAVAPFDQVDDELWR